MNLPIFNSLPADALLPVIIQDDRTLQVLMLGHMNREACDASLAGGRVILWDDKEKCLCPVGGSAEDFLEIVSATPADRGEALLIRAIPHGAGGNSRFAAASNPNEGFIRLLQSVIQGRHRSMPEGSYSTNRFI